MTREMEDAVRESERDTETVERIVRDTDEEGNERGASAAGVVGTRRVAHASGLLARTVTVEGCLAVAYELARAALDAASRRQPVSRDEVALCLTLLNAAQHAAQAQRALGLRGPA